VHGLRFTRTGMNRSGKERLEFRIRSQYLSLR